MACRGSLGHLEWLAYLGRWVHEDSSALEGFLGFLVPLASRAARVLQDLKETQVLLVSRALMVNLVQGDQ